MALRPVTIREIEHAWIPLPDGRRVAARIWLPKHVDDSPVPALLEYIPYRKNDVTAYADSLTHPYFAEHGYASLRVDIRGSGESDGVLYDEYTHEEHEDGLEILRWIAGQPWCNGRVGMFGLSWGGMTALQIAARRPPELNAIISICAADEHFGDDVYYMGGCLLNENLGWAALFQAQLSRPPDPRLVGERWREMWLQRLENIVHPFEAKIRHQRRDDYWNAKSVAGRYDAIECAVYAVGGWADGYHNSILRLMAELRAPRKALIGPWQHIFPHYEDHGPGPAIGFLQEAVRWWDHWLKDVPNGIMDEPMVTAWMQEHQRPRAYQAMSKGRWIRESAWPSKTIRERARHLNEGGLADEAGIESIVSTKSPQTLGADGGLWLTEHVGAEQPGDQRSDDGQSLTFDSLALTERIEILGTPTLRLRVSIDRSIGYVIARICDVAPGGMSSRVSYGLLNLAHRDGSEDPRPVEPGRSYDVTLRLKDVGYVFRPGHRIRVSLSTTYWPMVWPSPEAVTLSVTTGHSSLHLPVRPRPAAEESFEFEPSVSSTPITRTTLRPSDHRAYVERDLLAGVTTMTVQKDDGAYRLDDIGLAFDHLGRERYSICDDDPLSARLEVTWRVEFSRGEWRIRTENWCLMTASKDAFRITAWLDAYEGETRAFHRSWDISIPRSSI